MARIYRVNQIKFNQFKITSYEQRSVFKRYHSDKHLSEFVPTRWRQKSTGIDMEQNYVIVTLGVLDLSFEAGGKSFLTSHSMTSLESLPGCARCVALRHGARRDNTAERLTTR